MAGYADRRTGTHTQAAPVFAWPLRLCACVQKRMNVNGAALSVQWFLCLQLYERAARLALILDGVKQQSQLFFFRLTVCMVCCVWCEPCLGSSERGTRNNECEGFACSKFIDIQSKEIEHCCVRAWASVHVWCLHAGLCVCLWFVYGPVQRTLITHKFLSFSTHFSLV